VVAVSEKSQEGPVAGEIDAELAEMQACAAALQSAGQRVGALGAEAGAASAGAGGGVLAGPLTAAIDRFTAEVQQRVQQLGAAVSTTGSHVGIASGNYATTDAAASRAIDGTVPTTA
jgi:type II secretory pathway component PulM